LDIGARFDEPRGNVIESSLLFNFAPPKGRITEDIGAIRRVDTLKFQQQAETVSFDLPNLADYEVVALS